MPENKPWDIPNAELSLRLTELVQTSKFDTDVVEVDKEMVVQAAARIAAYDAMEKELAATQRRASFNRSCALSGETWTQEAEDSAAKLEVKAHG
jgi:hypothetical protein